MLNVLSVNAFTGLVVFLFVVLTFDLPFQIFFIYTSGDLQPIKN